MVPRSLAMFAVLAFLAPLAGQEVQPSAVKGQRVFSAGHSFHMFMPGILRELTQAAGIKDHVQAGVQGIGGSRVIQHWDLADDKNKVKAALRSGNVDVLTLSPIFLPDPGIDNLVTLGLEHNPRIRVTVQEFWMPFDHDQLTFPKQRPKKVERNGRTGPELHKMHAAYFKSMDDHVRELNDKHKKQVVFVVPTGQAVIALRERISAGQAPGLKTQDELFTDAIGHVRGPVKALVAYCHYAVIYRKSPVGLPAPSVLGKPKDGKPNDDGALNRLLQELAWDAVRQHPLSGVRVDKTP
ncbi:MAG: hypothetical protein L0Y71_25465 [Gemmataceae bacterium]|nr:hypothetical protein [Gemmataceae bacterium]